MIKPIETVYNGYRFRSRLEARWAVFFDALGIQYEYEKQGYALSNGAFYLPDFWLPSQGCFVEIKGQHLTTTERENIVQLALGANKNVFAYGPLGTPNGPDWDAFTWQPGIWADGFGHGFVHYADALTVCSDGDPHCAWWAICDNCNNPLADYICAEHACCKSPKANIWHQKVKDAYKTARSARFEHGEVPVL